MRNDERSTRTVFQSDEDHPTAHRLSAERELISAEAVRLDPSLRVTFDVLATTLAREVRAEDVGPMLANLRRHLADSRR